MLRLSWLLLLICFASSIGIAQTNAVSVALLDFGDSGIAKTVGDRLSLRLTRESLSVLDRDLTRAAARGVGYEGSLNLSRREARNLGDALGSEFFVLGDAQSIKRSPSTGDPYFESYASIFVVSARTGNLVNWSRPSFRAPTSEAAENLLLAEISGSEVARGVAILIRRAQEAEMQQRNIVASSEPIIEVAPDDEKEAGPQAFSLPKPFRRLKPAYTDEAAHAEAEGTVDVLVDVDERGEVQNAQIERWAGFGLDQSTLDTVRQLHFFPAMREGKPIAMRVLLRYNFRKPPKDT